MAAGRAVDELTDEALDGLPMTSVDRIEADLLAEHGDCRHAIEALARLVAGGGLHLRWRSHLGVCDQCTSAHYALTALGFGDRIEAWSADPLAGL